MAELVDAPDSKSGSFGSVGSIPTLGTTDKECPVLRKKAGLFYVFNFNRVRNRMSVDIIDL